MLCRILHHFDPWQAATAHQHSLQHGSGDPAQVDADLHRLFPAHPQLTSAKAATALQRILAAFCRHQRGASYTPALLSVAALALEVLGQEEPAFWLLVALFDDGLCAPCFAQVRVVTGCTSALLLLCPC